MYKLKRPTLRAMPVESTVAISAEALTAATVGPAPLTDAAVIEQLKQHVRAKDGTIGRLHDEIRALKSRLTSDGDCHGCAGLRKTIAELEAGGREDRATIARLQLADPAGRERTLPFVAPRAD